jgi:hypothetical protein
VLIDSGRGKAPALLMLAGFHGRNSRRRWRSAVCCGAHADDFRVAHCQPLLEDVGDLRLVSSGTDVWICADERDGRQHGAHRRSFYACAASIVDLASEPDFDLRVSLGSFGSG